jgi:PKD repeat protein
MGGRGRKKIITKVIVKKDRRRLSLPQKIIAGVPIKLGLIGSMNRNLEWKFDDGSNNYGNSLVAKVFHRVGQIKVTLVDKLRRDPPLTEVINVIRDTRSLKASVEAVLPNKKVVFTALNFLGKNIKWDFGDGTIKISAKKLISHTYSRLGTFNVTASDFGGRGKKLFQKRIFVSNILPGFRIENLEFTFSNGKYYTIAKKKQYKLDYNLRIKAVGSGILQGKIILDGVNLGFFDIYFNGSNIGFLNNSKKPKLSLINLGMHRLSFAFINYNYSGAKPFLRYFVTEGERISLKAPKDGSVLDQSNPVKFTWTTPYKYLNYEYSYSLIPFQFLNDNQIKWKKATKKNSIFLDISKYGKGKYSYLIIRAINKSGVIKAVSQIYFFKVKREIN